jgi:hypothetical protein
MAWRKGPESPWRTGPGAEDGTDAGPGWVFIVDPERWGPVDFPLGDLADSQRRGFRYLITSEDGAAVTHLLETSASPVSAAVLRM